MPDEDQETSQPSLEPPKLFGRRRRADEPVAPKVAEPAVASEVEAQVEAEVEAEVEAGAEERMEVRAGADDGPTSTLPVSDPTWMFEPPTEPESESEPERGAQPVAAVLPAEAGTPLFADEVDEAPAPTRVRRERAPRRTPQPKASRAARAPRVAKVSAPSLPAITGWVAAAVTGVVIGLLLVGMTAGSLQACESVRGTSTCGGSGVLILTLILAVLVALGGLLLRIFGVPDPGSTSFLALGMVAVISLLFLLDVLLSWWMLLVIPAISVAMYLLAYWVTTAFVEPAKEPAER
jgi:hypothetical protein